MPQTYSTRTLQTLGLSAPWLLPMSAPKIVGFYGADPVAVDVGGVRVERRGPDPVLGLGRETVHQLLERAAQQCGTTDVFRLIYA